METKEGKVKITRSEMLLIRRMDHRQLEDYLSMIHKKGFEEGHKDGLQKQASRNRDIEEAKERTWKRELEEQRKDWQQKLEEWEQERQQALESALAETKGIGQARKELFLENLRQKLEGRGVHVSGKDLSAGQEAS